MAKRDRDNAPRGDRPEGVLHIAEIPYESGAMRFRYSRYVSADGTRWVRHGLFVAYHENGRVSSEGKYVDGLEEGMWRDYHKNGQLAAEGTYVHGKEHGYWRFWDEDGNEEEPTEYEHGEEVG
jgi:antitoxin component YwqK of YwqJK toxin-antitoxin module